jgi:hypothetical protein
MTTENNNNFIITDNNSKILSMIPETWRIPLTIVSHIKQYGSVDEYVLELIQDRLSMYSDSRDELGESFQDYMREIKGLEGVRAAEEDDDEESKSKKEYVSVPIDADLVERLANVEQRKLEREESQQQISDNDDNTKKFVRDVNANFYSKKEEREKGDLK